MIKLLIAEDDPVSLKILEKCTREMEFMIFTAKNGQDAQATFLKENIQMAIMDWMMPKISGIELCEHMRQESSEDYIYIILISEKNKQNDIIEGLTAGADDYITKPFNIHELKARLKIGRRIISLHQQLLESKRRIHEIAIRDELTTLFNRAEILRVLNEEYEQSQREQKPLSTIMLDIDHFKKINDTFGHQIGDSVLTNVSLRLKRSLRVYDKIGRYGGEEFLAILPNCNLIEATEIAERLRSSIGNHRIKTDMGNLNISISLGCSSTDNPHMRSVKELLSTSDFALYEAKKEGRNRVITI